MTIKTEYFKITCNECKESIKLPLVNDSIRKRENSKRKPFYYPRTVDKVNIFWRLHEKKCKNSFNIIYI